MRLYINAGSGNVDYTRHVLDGSIAIEDSINVPTLVTFTLSPVDNTFIKPSRSSYVTLVSEILAPNGGYGSGKIIATGVITTEPERKYLGLYQGRGPYKYAQYTYDIKVTSDEWFINCNTVPFIPAFVNQTDSQILASLANILMPGFYDLSNMAPGNLVPYYQYDPSQTWSDIAKTFGDQYRYYYKCINRKIYYQPFGDAPLGIVYNENTQKENQLNPTELVTSVVTVPPVNDCIVIGDTEPQNNWDNYYVGDGFSSNFQLPYQMFQGTSSDLLTDAWTENSISTGNWTDNDPQGVITLVDSNGNAVGALNVIQKGNTGVYVPPVNATYIQAKNGLELAGGLNLQHGQVVFNDTAVGGGGIIGGLYPNSNFIPGNVICGFGITGQSSVGPYSVTGVQHDANTNLVTFYIPGNVAFQTGNVVIPSGLSNASFANGVKYSVFAILQKYDVNGALTSQVTCIGVTTYSSAYPFQTDSGSIVANVNDVLVTASGAAGIVMQPIVSGAFVGPQVISQVNHQYVLQTWIGAQSPTRYTRSYTNMTQTATYGNQTLAASGMITFVVTDYNLGVYVIEQQNPLFGLFPAAPPPVVTKYTVGPNASLPPFALYCLVNGIDLNVSINYTDLSIPPQGTLTVQSLTGMSGGNLPWYPYALSVPIHYQLGFGMVNQTAQISQSGEAYALAFYTDDIPSVGSRIRFQSWEAGQSIARVRDPIAIANEAKISGDTGVRSAIMQNLSPTPRTSAECEAAAAAAILDREYPQFQGTYTVTTIPGKFETLYAPSLYDFPHTGRFFYINSPVRGVTGQNFYVNSVRIQIIELRAEVMNISIDYGPDLYLERLLPTFLEREQTLLVPKQNVSAPNPITLAQVLNAYLPTLDNSQITTFTNSLTGCYVTIDLGAPPITACEVRNVDNGWGVANQGRIGLFTTQVFTLPRTSRSQKYYMRAINGPFYSRFSRVLNMQHPMVPSPPLLVSTNASIIVAGLAGDVRDIYGLELRASGGNIFYQPNNPNPFENLSILGRGAVYRGTIQYYNTGGNIQGFNIQTEYFGPGNTSNPDFNFAFLDGDVVFLTGFTDGSFSNVYTNFITNYLNNASFPGPYIHSHDYNKTDNLLQSAVSPVGSCQLYYRPTSFAVATNMTLATGGLVTVKTTAAHGFTVGEPVCVAVGWVDPGPTYPAGARIQLSTPICNAQTIYAIPDSTHFQIQIASTDPWYNGSYTGGVLNSYTVSGNVSPLPSGFLNLAKGTIVQKPVFSPADLVIDLSNPDISQVLDYLAAQSSAHRVGGLTLYFFNLTWDYSAPTLVGSFIIPSLSGTFVDITSQTIQWSIQQGLPDGHRVVTYDPATGLAQSRFTIDHPNNVQTLKRANMPAPDWLNSRVITVTPFDALGDGIPTTINWQGSSGASWLGAGLPTGQPGDILRWNVAGDNTWDAVQYAQVFDGVLASATNVGTPFGAGAATAPVGLGAAASWTGNAPTPSIPYPTTTSSFGSASTSVVIGVLHTQDGNRGTNHIKSWWRMEHRLGISAVANTRYWFGFFVWASGSTLGSNGTNFINNSQLAADSFNRTCVGWRWSAGTDTTFKAVVIQAGASPNTNIIDTGFTADSNMHQFYVTQDYAYTSYNFFIDGQEVASVPCSVITFNPAFANDAYGTCLYTGDNKNTATNVAIKFGTMFMNFRTQ